MRTLADKKLLSVVELNAAEERYRAAEMSLLNARQRVDQIEVDISNARLKLTELQTSLHVLESDSSTKTRNARAQYGQTLANLRQERANVAMQTRELESKVAQAEPATQPRRKTARHGFRHDACRGDDRRAQGQECRRDRVRRLRDRDGRADRRPADGRSQCDQQGRRVRAARRRSAHQSRRLSLSTVRDRPCPRDSRLLPAVGSNSAFIVQLDLIDEKLSANGTEYNLFPGLSVQADLITGRQRLLDVLMQGQKESRDAAAQ